MKNEGKTTSMVEDQTKKIPSITFLNLALVSMAASAVLALTGRKGAATFVGQWVPTILILGTYNKIAKTFSRDEQGLSEDSVKPQFGATSSSGLRTQPAV